MMHARPPVTVRPHQRALYGVTLMAALAACVLIRIVDPTSTAFFPSCPFRALTGYWCPGCGSTRATNQLLKGDISAAFGLNPLFVLSLPVAIYAIGYLASGALRGRSLPRLFVPSKVIWVYLFVIVAFGVLRNLPFEAVAWLAP